MADVLIVCVREDEPQAKALAEMFEAAGFSIGGAPSSDGALRSSGAGVVVWSQASIRSRPFLDAAQRVINADKAVVASLIDPPPPSSIGNSPAFDLSRWDGDPNDPSLDPLFFAVDRMVNSQRANADGPSVPAAPAYEPPPPRQAPPPSRSAPPRSNARPSGDSLQSKSEHWRAIRDSRDPADFMDYIARYGADGAFAEVAELRLKQLTAAGESRPQRAPPRNDPQRMPARNEMPRREAAPPAVRREPPPRRPDPPPPPPRRAEPPPVARQPMFDRAGPPRATYERPELRDPPKGEGGALRAFILIALLGGVALAGGLYFGGGNLPDFGGGGAHQAAPTQNAATPPQSAPPPDANSLSDLAQTNAPVGAPAAQVRRAPPQAERTTPVSSRTTADNTTPPPQSSFASNTGGGPVSLIGPQVGGGSSPSTSASAVIPLGPQAEPPPTILASTSQARPPAAAAANVRWATRPSARRIADLYPDRASAEGVGGRVELDCAVNANLGISCSVASETPAGRGFGRAALGASSSYRAQPTLSDGSSAIGSHTRIAVQFQAPAR